MEYLQEVLQICLKERIGVSGEPPHDVTELARHLGAYFKLHLQGDIPELTFQGDPEFIGTAAEGLQVGEQITCDFLLNIQVPPEVTLTAEEPDPECPGSWLIRKTSDADTPTDKFMQNGPNGQSYFAPVEISKHIQAKLNHVSKTKNFQKLFPKVESIECKSVEDDPTLTYEVTFTSIGFNRGKAVPYTGNGPVFSSASFEMKLYPGIGLGHRHLMARPLPQHKSAGEIAPLLWMQGFAHEERDRVRHAERGCVRSCVRLLKHLGTRRPEKFGPLDPFVYKTLLFYVMDTHKYPDEWRDEHLAERFQDLFTKLGNVLKEKKLDEYHQRKKEKKAINVFIPRYSECYLEDLSAYVDDVNEKGEQGYMALFQS